MERATTTKSGNESGRDASFAIHVLPEELDLAAAIFCFVHRGCGAAYACQKGSAVTLRCGLCAESRVYAVSDPNFDPSVEMRPLFRKPDPPRRKPFHERMAF